MDNYLSSKASYPVKVTKAKKHEEKEPAKFTEVDVEFDSIKEPWYQKVLDVFIGKPKVKKVKLDEEEPEEEAQEDPDEKELEEMDEEKPKKKGFFSWLFGNVDEPDDDFKEVEEKESAGLPEDVKRMLKIQHFWLQQLTPEKIKEFKASPDYEEYKSLLEKYHLIKKQE